MKLEREETEVGPLPVGPAGDAAEAAARATPAAGPGAASRGAIAGRVVPVLAAAGLAAAVLVLLRRSRR